MDGRVSSDRGGEKPAAPGAPAATPVCPFGWPVTVDRLWMYPAAVYCRIPSGRVRVPGRATVAEFCASGRHAECPVYRGAPDPGKEIRHGSH